MIQVIVKREVEGDFRIRYDNRQRTGRNPREPVQERPIATDAANVPPIRGIPNGQNAGPVGENNSGWNGPDVNNQDADFDGIRAQQQARNRTAEQPDYNVPGIDYALNGVGTHESNSPL